MRRFLWLSLGALLFAGVAVASSGGATHAEARWVITDLCPRGGWDPDYAEAVAINERGQIVGTCRTGKEVDGEDITHSFLWSNGHVADLGALGRGWSAYASAMNEQGQVVGWSQAGGFDARSKAFLWSDGRMTDLGTLGGPDSFPTAINERSQVVGVADIGKPSGTPVAQHAFLWAGGKMTDLGVARRDSYAAAINERGQIVGSANTNADSWFVRPVLWWKGKMLDLGTLKERDGWATDINERGQIIGGIGKDDAEQRRAVAWHGGKCIELGSLSGRPWSEALGMNARGQVVGVAYARFNWDTDDFVRERAFLWVDGKITDLGTLGGKETSFDWFAADFAVDPINDKGQIVGFSQTASGREHAFFWQGGKMTDLGTLPGGKESHAIAINERAAVVGWSESRNGDFHPVLWTLKR